MEITSQDVATADVGSGGSSNDSGTQCGAIGGKWVEGTNEGVGNASVRICHNQRTRRGMGGGTCGGMISEGSLIIGGDTRLGD